MTLAVCCTPRSPLLEVTDPETGDRVRPGRHHCGSCIGDGVVGARVSPADAPLATSA
jgi:hypothetical protein